MNIYDISLSFTHTRLLYIRRKITGVYACFEGSVSFERFAFDFSLAEINSRFNRRNIRC